MKTWAKGKRVKSAEDGEGGENHCGYNSVKSRGVRGLNKGHPSPLSLRFYPIASPPTLHARLCYCWTVGRSRVLIFPLAFAPLLLYQGWGDYYDLTPCHPVIPHLAYVLYLPNRDRKLPWDVCRTSQRRRRNLKSPHELKVKEWKLEWAKTWENIFIWLNVSEPLELTNFWKPSSNSRAGMKKVSILWLSRWNCWRKGSGIEEILGEWALSGSRLE